MYMVTFEQHGLELNGSTFTWFFNSKYDSCTRTIRSWLNLRMQNHRYGQSAYKEGQL